MTRVRRTQAERTAATRAALLGATIDCLVERGHSRTTTTDVARRAGVSPGALLHHFPTKIDLLCAAVGHLFEQRTTEFKKAMADLPVGAERLGAAVDLLWSMFSGPTFVAWLELGIAARSDPELAIAVQRLDEEFIRQSIETTRELFAAEAAVDPAFPDLAVGLTFAVMEGLALTRAVHGHEPVPVARLLEAYKQLVRPAVPAAPGAREEK